MKHFPGVGLIFLLTALAAGAQPYYPQVYFKGSKGFLLSDSGRVYLSQDGGSSWQVKQLDGSAEVRGIHFPTDQVGYLVGTTTLLKTADGGATWTRPDGIHSMLRQVAFLDAEVGLAVGVATILRTEDGGAEVQSTALSTPTGPMTFNDVAFPARDAAILVGLDGWIRRSADSGRNWDEVASPVTEDLEAVHFPTASVGYAVGDEGTLVKTVNAGVTWTRQTSGTTSDLKDVHFLDAQNGWAVGGGTLTSLMLYTQDGGATWKQRTQPARYQLSSICFVDGSRGFASGTLGDFLRTTDGGLTWGSLDPAGIRGNGRRARGPWREGDRIAYDLAAPVRIEARLLDVSGRQARLLFAGEQAAGKHSLRLPRSGWAAGGYLVDFRAADTRQVIPLLGK